MELELDVNKKYSFADYLTWIDDKRRELLNGFIHLMTPAPRRIHQEISMELSFLLKNCVKKEKCKIYTAPFDVRLPKNGTKNDEIYTVVQPDLTIVCDKAKLDEMGCVGAPDMIIEIVSPSSSKTDVEDKYKIYEEAGVKEYWIVFPQDKTISVFVLKKAKYEFIGMFAKDSKVKVNIFEDFYVDLAEVFEDED